MKYDYLIVGAGLSGSVLAERLKSEGKKCLVIDRRSHLGGNIYSQNQGGIEVHMYGAHIFHTSSKEVWDYVNKFTEFKPYTHSPVANYKGEIYPLPFNMNTFAKMWNVSTPAEAKAIIDEQIKKENIKTPANLEQQALNLVGRDIYEKLIKEYTEKQWGVDCSELSADIIKRLPMRFTFDNNYFNDAYQGIPLKGYTDLATNLLAGTEVILDTDYKQFLASTKHTFDSIIYTGMIDEFYDYELGHLEYRSLEFKTEQLDTDNYQGASVVNYNDHSKAYTRIIEHKHFNNTGQKGTIITKEYPKTWSRGKEPYYPVNNEKNMTLYNKYVELSKKDKNVIFAGRLGTYQYFDMDKVIIQSLSLFSKLQEKTN